VRKADIASWKASDLYYAMIKHLVKLSLAIPKKGRSTPIKTCNLCKLFGGNSEH
jgi:hypothetical protein